MGGKEKERVVEGKKREKEWWKGRRESESGRKKRGGKEGGMEGEIEEERVTWG